VSRLRALSIVTLIVVGAGSSMAAPPTTWGELQTQMKNTKDPGRRAAAMLRFANDDHPSLSDRLRATRKARALLPATDGRRTEAFLVEAKLHAVGSSWRKRRDALLNARASAARLRQDEKKVRLDEAVAGEDAMAALADVLRKREASAPSGGAAVDEQTRSLAAKVEGALPAWLALSDERQHGAGRLLLARAAALQGDVAGATRIASDVVDALGDGRDAAAVRADAWRLLARWFEAQGAWSDAAAAAVAGDRSAAVDPKKAAPTSTTLATPYVRTKETAALCKRAKAEGVSCARVETQRFGDRTFYDFSREPKGAFDAARADDVLAEYESLLDDCMKQGAKANLTTSTHVELEWSVNNDGKLLKSFDLRPMRLRGTSVDQCLQKAFALFRYPPYKGEMQHVRLTFDVGELQAPTVAK
jgi:hypothetical protein